jgi:hypothetical protein
MKNEKLEIKAKRYFNKIVIFTNFVLYFINQLYFQTFYGTN